MIVTLCGSAKFEAAFHYWNEKLTLAGNVVFSLAVFPSVKGGEKNWYTEEQKIMLDKMHKEKIETSEGIFVIDLPFTELHEFLLSPREPYIGDSTRSEIAHAKKLYKLVDYASDFMPTQPRPE